MSELFVYQLGSLGVQTSVIQYADGVHRAAFTREVDGDGFDLEVGEYVAQLNAKRAPGSREFAVVSWEALEPMLRAAQAAAHIRPWVRIPYDEWIAGLEALPPEKWERVDGVELFRFCEYLTGNITTHFAKLADGRCFCANRFASDEYTTLALEVKAAAGVAA